MKSQVSNSLDEILVRLFHSLNVFKVSFVERGAVKRPFIVIKSEGGMTMDEKTVNDLKEMLSELEKISASLEGLVSEYPTLQDAIDALKDAMDVLADTIEYGYPSPEESESEETSEDSEVEVEESKDTKKEEAENEIKEEAKNESDSKESKVENQFAPLIEEIKSMLEPLIAKVSQFETELNSVSNKVSNMEKAINEVENRMKEELDQTLRNIRKPTNVVRNSESKRETLFKNIF